MPFHNDTIFPTPDDSTVLWRYLSFAKFVSMLATRSLWFCRSDRLGDPHEGAFGAASNLILQQSFKGGPDFAIGPEGVTQQLADLRAEARLCTVVNCWHEGSAESAAMWSSYASSEGSVAIRTTVGRLKQSLEHAPEPILIAPVEYWDYSVQAFMDINLIEPLLKKRLSFAHEREIRCLYLNPPSEWLSKPGQTTFPDGGAKIDVDLPALIEDVYVAPGSPPWVLDSVRETLRVFGIAAEPHQSAMDDPALL